MGKKEKGQFPPRKFNLNCSANDGSVLAGRNWGELPELHLRQQGGFWLNRGGSEGGHLPSAFKRGILGLR